MTLGQRIGKEFFLRLKSIPVVGWVILVEILVLFLMMGDMRFEVLGLYHRTAYRRLGELPTEMKPGMLNRLYEARDTWGDEDWGVATNLFRHPVRCEINGELWDDLEMLDKQAHLHPENGFFQVALAIRAMEGYFTKTPVDHPVSNSYLLGLLADCAKRDNKNALFPAFETIVQLREAVGDRLVYNADTKETSYPKFRQEKLKAAWDALNRAVNERITVVVDGKESSRYRRIEEQDYLQRITRGKLAFLERKDVDRLHSLERIARTNLEYGRHLYAPVEAILSLARKNQSLVQDDQLRQMACLGRFFLETPGQTLDAGLEGLKIEQGCLTALLDRLKERKKKDNIDFESLPLIGDWASKRDPVILEIQFIEERLGHLADKKSRIAFGRWGDEILRPERQWLLWCQFILNAAVWGAIISFFAYLIVNPMIWLTNLISERPMAGDQRYPTRTIVTLILLGVFGTAGFYAEMLFKVAEEIGYRDPIIALRFPEATVAIASFLKDPECYMGMEWSIMTGLLVFVALLQLPVWYFFAMRTKANWLERVYRPRFITWSAMLQLFVGITAGAVLDVKNPNAGIFSGSGVLPFLIYGVGPLPFVMLVVVYFSRGLFNFQGKENWRQLFRPFLRGLRRMFLMTMAVTLVLALVAVPMLKAAQNRYLTKVGNYIEKQDAPLRASVLSEPAQNGDPSQPGELSLPR